MSPRNATEVGSRRTYRVPGAEGPLPSVTTVLKLTWPKEWLGAYGAKWAVNYIAEDPERWAMAYREKPDAAMRAAKGAPWRRRDAAADFGTTAHKLLETWAAGQDAYVPEALEDHAAVLREWWTTYRPEIVASEFQCANLEYGYAGSGDLIANVYGRLLLIDLKTNDPLEGEVAPSPLHRAEWRIQLAAYRKAQFVFDGDAVIGPMPRVEGCAVLWIPKSHPSLWMFLEVGASAPEFFQFVNALHLFRYYEANKRSSVEAEWILPQAEASDDAA